MADEHIERRTYVGADGGGFWEVVCEVEEVAITLSYKTYYPIQRTKKQT
jgi:hypothetical protein